MNLSISLILLIGAILIADGIRPGEAVPTRRRRFYRRLGNGLRIAGKSAMPKSDNANEPRRFPDGEIITSSSPFTHRLRPRSQTLSLFPIRNKRNCTKTLPKNGAGTNWMQTGTSSLISLPGLRQAAGGTIDLEHDDVFEYWWATSM